MLISTRLSTRHDLAKDLALALRDAGAGARVVAVVPIMLTYFADSPKRYEVTEVEVIIEEAELTP